MSAVARRYAKALFALARDAGALQPTADQLERVALVADDASVAPVLRNPLLSPVRRRELAEALARELSLSDLLARFVRLLADQQRLAELPSIFDHFQRLLDDELERVRVTIRSAAPLDANQQHELLATFSKLTGKQVIPNVVIDPVLLGGVIVEAEGKVFDGSVRMQLNRLAQQLVGTAAL